MLACSWGTLSCEPAGAPRPILRAPSKAGMQWTEITSPHFVLRTDLWPSSAATLSEYLERTYDVLEQSEFSSSPGSTKVTIVDFAYRVEYQAFEPPGSAGQMYSQLPNDIEGGTTLVFFGKLDADAWGARINFTHELTHHLTHASLGNVPLWFDEGLAQYCSSVRLDREDAVIGITPFELDVPIHENLPTVAEITHADRDAFYAGLEVTDPNDPRSKRTASLYVGSWWLVHMLNNGPENVTSTFHKVMLAVQQGEAFTSAWNRIMVPNGTAWLEPIFREYSSRDKVDLRRVRLRPSSASAPMRSRAMNDLEALLLWARLVDWRGPQARAGLDELEAARTLDPDSPEVAYYEALRKLQLHDFSEAVALFRRALMRSPNEPRYLFGLAMAQNEVFLSDRTPENGRALLESAIALERVASSPSQLALSGELHALQHDVPGGTKLCDRALAIDPTCIFCAIARAHVAFVGGDYESAVHFQRQAIAFLPDEADARPFAEVLRKYEAALHERGRGTVSQ